MMIYQNSLNNLKKEQNIFIIFLRDDLSMDIPFNFSTNKKLLYLLLIVKYCINT